jgi:phage terminase large subunit
MEVVEVELPYRPRNWALPFHASLKRFSALVLHRRAGKTTAVLNHHLRAAMDDEWEASRLRYLMPEMPESQLADLLRRRTYWHVMPTYHQGKLTGAWDTLKEITAPIDDAKKNESELLVTLANGNKIQIIGGDKPDSLRGPALSGVSLDEYSQIPSNAFSEVLSKALADHVGYAVFSGTIKGSDQLYQTYEAARNSPEWYSLWQDVEASLATEEGATIEALRRAMEDDRKLVMQGLMTQGEFDQEWFLSREAAIKGAFYALEMRDARAQGRIGQVAYSTSMAVDTDWDLGIDAMAVWFTQSEPSGAIRVIDYEEMVGGGLPAMIKVLKDKPYVYGEHWAPHDIEVREISSGTTRRQAARALGIDFKVTPKIGVADGINSAQLTLSRCWFDEEKCKQGIEALLHYRRTFNQRMARFTEEPFHDWASHGADAFRGLAVRHKTPELQRAEMHERIALPQDWAWS